VKISTDIDNNILQKVPRILPVELEVTVHSSHDLNEESFFIKRIIVEIPPLYSGKQLVTHLHQLKLDPLIV
jgi:hypothetical protein